MSKQNITSLDDMMAVMRAVDTLHNQQILVDNKLGDKSRRLGFLNSLRKIYRNQGIEVSDTILKEAVTVFEQEQTNFNDELAVSVRFQQWFESVYLRCQKWLSNINVTIVAKKQYLKASLHFAGDESGHYPGALKKFIREEKQYREAAEQGDPKAQIELGLIYLNGRGVLQNYDEARQWFKKAAEQGHEPGKCYLKSLEESGLPDVGRYVHPQKVKAFIEDAEKGDPNAQYHLATLYFEDKKTRNCNLQLAYIWISLAIKGGENYKDAINLQKLIKSNGMTPESIKMAKEMVDGFVPSNGRIQLSNRDRRSIPKNKQPSKNKQRHKAPDGEWKMVLNIVILNLLPIFYIAYSYGFFSEIEVGDLYQKIKLYFTGFFRN